MVCVGYVFVLADAVHIPLVHIWRFVQNCSICAARRGASQQVRVIDRYRARIPRRACGYCTIMPIAMPV